MRRRVRAAAASLFFFLAAQARKLITLRVSWVGGGSPKMPHAEQRRRCGYRSLPHVLCVLDLLSLGSRAIWAIEVVEKVVLRPPLFFLRRNRRVTLCYGL